MGLWCGPNASFKSFVPIEVAMDPEEYKKRLRSSDEEEEKQDSQGPQDPGNPNGGFPRGKAREQDPPLDDRSWIVVLFPRAVRAREPTPGYTVNALMENRNRILLGVGVEIFRSSTSEEQGALSLARPGQAASCGFKPTSLGADKGFFHEEFIGEVFQRKIEPHIAADKRGSSRASYAGAHEAAWACRTTGPNGVEKRSRNSLAKVRSFMDCGASDGANCIEYERRPG